MDTNILINENNAKNQDFVIYKYDNSYMTEIK